MSELSQFYTKDIADIKNYAAIICQNLAPLLGCSISDQEWSPMVGYKTCKALNIVGTNCSNVSDATAGNNVITYSFAPFVTTGSNEIWRKAIEFNSDVLSSSYNMYIANRIPAGSTASEKLQLSAEYSEYSDSTIFESIMGNNKIKVSALFNQICLIMLSSFSIRYYLFGYSMDTDDSASLNVTEINSSVIQRIINNIDYVKYILSLDDSLGSDYLKSNDYARGQLTVLRKNLLMISPNVLQYLVERS